MKILIAGGTGLVGQELGKALVAKGHELYILTRSKEKASLNCPFPHTALNYDELQSHPVIEKLDSIVNLAGTNLTDQRWNKNFKQLLYNSRINTTKQLTELAKSKCKCLSSFVSTSAVGIYGDTGLSEVTEDHEKSYGFLGKLCQDWEEPVIELKDIRSVILRVGIVFSEKGGALAEMVPPIQAGVGGHLASGNQYMSWIDIDDLVNMFVFAIEQNISGTFNAVAPNPETNRSITKKIADHLSRKTLLPVPYFALRLIMGEMATHLVEIQNISSQKIQSKGFQFIYKNVQDSIIKRVPKLNARMERRLIFEQWIPEPKEEVFPFFSEAKNLEKITPENLNFKILSTSTEKIEKNTKIHYKLKIQGIPVGWTTLITDWNPPHHFADNQEKGPYKKWYHQHFFTDLAGGTLMTDQVDLVLPLGPVGYGAASWKVLSDVQKIFKYRREVIYRMYNEE